MANFKMEIDLNVLNHLGIKLYSSTPAVLSEVVANAWDADAENVLISINGDVVVISDDGNGMTEEDANKKYLTVGYQKRENNEGESLVKKRKVMGRKGIGKLSLFSIADVVQVHSKRNGKKIAFEMNAKAIESEINKNKTKGYSPKEIDFSSRYGPKNNGTTIILKSLKGTFSRTEKYLKTRIARRFSFVEMSDFIVKVNNSKVSIKDRDYFHKLEGIWNTESHKLLIKNCNTSKLKSNKTIDGFIDSKCSLKGWIGTVTSSGDLNGDDNENLNKISIIVRGKLAQEDILLDFPEAGLFTKYLIGEIEADFLDEDDEEDIATSNRQEIRKEDPRYIKLKGKVKDYLNSIRREWDALRETESKEEAMKNPMLKKWFDSLGTDSKKVAISMFKKISKLKTETEEERKLLYRHSVYAFENFRRKDILSKLDGIGDDNFQEFLELFKDLDDLEAAYYFKIIKERLEVIEKMERFIKNNELEKLIQNFLYNHLWLLDPSWERAAGDGELEKSYKSVEKEFKLTDEEAKGRIDIQYKAASGKHVIIELKKPDVNVNIHDLVKQIDKYRKTLKKVLKGQDRESEEIEVICLLGLSPFKGMDREDKEIEKKNLTNRNARIVLYSDLIKDTKKMYSRYLKENQKISEIQKLVDSI